MRQVIDRGAPLIEDPDRLAGVSAVGVDETAYLRASVVSVHDVRDRDRRPDPGRAARLLDVVEGRSGTVLAAWLADRDQAWRAGITTASLDPFRGYATALSNHLPGAVRVLDPFHVVRLALAAVDDVRRRVQQAQTGHRGRTGDPLYGIRRVLRRRADHLSTRARARLEAGLVAGDPDGEVTIAWTIAQQVMALYQLDDPAQAHATGRAS